MKIEDQIDQPIEKDQTKGVNDDGLGRAIVFLHGFLENNDVWKEFTRPLQKEYRTIAIELPGHGSCPESAVGKDLSAMADYVHGIITSLRVEKCMLVGHSMGGYVSLAFAEKYPEMLSGLCLFHSTAKADNDEKKDNRNKTIEFIKKNGMGKFAESFVKPLFHSSYHETGKDTISKMEKTVSEAKTEEAAAAIEAMRDRPDRTEVLKKLECPVLFIIGKDDQNVLAETLVDQVALPADSQANFFSNIAHMGMFENNEETALLLEQFADRVFETIRI